MSTLVNPPKNLPSKPPIMYRVDSRITIEWAILQGGLADEFAILMGIQLSHTIVDYKAKVSKVEEEEEEQKERKKALRIS